MDDKKHIIKPQNNDTEFYKQVSDLLAEARGYAKRQLDSTIVTAYYEIGRMIVEREQQGQKRAKYGANLIKGLSEYLTNHHGKGFSVINLKSIRKFYQVYSPSIQQSLTAKSDTQGIRKPLINIVDANAQKRQTLSALFNDVKKQQTMSAKFILSWSHYQILMRINDEAARCFYEIETVNQQWSVRQLQRKLAEWVEEFNETCGGDSK
jgi:hypothetical protein